MSGDPRGLDELAAAHLDGALDAAGAAALAARLVADPAARSRFADLLARDLLLAERARESAQVQRPSVRRQAVRMRRRPVPAAAWPLAAAAVVAAAVGWVLLAGPPAVEEAPAVPEVLAGDRPVRSGDAIDAGAGPVTIAWRRDGTRLVIEPGGHARLLDGPGKRLELREGAISATVSPQPADAPLAIATPLATAVVVGTRFRLAHQPASGTGATTVLAVDEGVVRLDAGPSVAVRAGDRAQVDARGITLTTVLAGGGAGAAIPLRLVPDAEPPPGAFVADHDWDRSPPAAVRIAHGDRTRTPIGDGPWPAFWRVQQWRPGSMGEYRFGPHPADGTRSLCLIPVSGPASAQVLTRPFPASADVATIYLRYRTEAAAQPALWMEVAGVRTRLVHLPLTGPRWRWAALVPAPRTTREPCVVVIQNYGRTPEDVLAIGDLRHGAPP